MIELLVVVAILSILAALLLPALNRAKEQSKRAVCASNLHQIAVAFTLYAEEDSGQKYPTGWLYLNQRVPYTLPASTATNLMSYGLSGDVRNSVWHCPSAGYGRGWVSGPPEPTFALDFYAVQTQLKAPGLVFVGPGSGYFGDLSPTRIGDPTGPLIGDQVTWWWSSYTTWNSSHTGRTSPSLGTAFGNEGYNQAFSDGRVTWYPRSAFPAGAPAAANSWIYYLGGNWPYWYWVEK